MTTQEAKTLEELAARVDLVERLRKYRPPNEWGDGVNHVICDEAAAEINRLRERGNRLAGAVEAARKIIDDIDEYQKEPERGDYGVECACCMGELLDDDREAIAGIDATLSDWRSARG